MVSELPKLLPLLLRALELEQLDLRAQAVDTLTLLVKEVPESIKHQASSIVSILLKNAVCADPSQDTEPFTVSDLCALRHASITEYICSTFAYALCAASPHSLIP